MKIKTRLIIGFAVTIVCAWMAIFHANAMADYAEERFTTLENDIIPRVILISDIENMVRTTNRHFTGYAIYGTEEIRLAALNDMRNLEDMGQEQLELTAKVNPVDMAAAEEIAAKISTFNLRVIEIMTMVEQGANYDELAAMSSTNLRPVMDSLTEQAQAQRNLYMADMAAAEAGFWETRDLIFRANITAGIIITGLGIIVAIFVTRQVTEPLNDLRQGTEIIGTGNLDYKVDSGTKDEIGELSRAFDDMTERLSSSLVSIDNLNEEIKRREETERALRESEEKLKRIFEAAGDGVTVTDLNGNIIEANDSFIKMVGLKPDEDIIGKNMSEFIPPYEIQRSKAYLQGQLARHSVVVAELIIRRANGTEFPVEINASVLRNASGERIGQVAILRDISQRKQMETDLGKSLKELRCLYGIARIAQQPEITLFGIYQEIIQLMPHCWRHPDTAGARITYHEQEYKTDGFEVSGWKQTADIIVYGQKTGAVEVSYRDKMPELDEGPFSKEERQLLDTVAERLSRITERKQTELALKDSEEKYRGLVNHIKAGIARSTIGPPDKILELNPAMEQITGYSREELLNMDARILYANVADRERLVKEIKKTNGTMVRELVWKRKDGREVVVRDTLLPVRDKNGEILYIDAFAEDITAQKLAESALRTSEEKYRTLVENATDLIYMTDADDRILSMNRIGAAWLKVKPENAIGKSIFEVLPRKIAEEFSKESWLVFKTGRTVISEAKIEISGQERWSSNSLSPIKNEHDEVVSVMGVSRDVTERRRMIKELQEKNEQLDAQNEELQVQSEELITQQHELVIKTEEVTKATRMKSEFLANMSHELRTPLNVIIGFSQLMADEVPGKINARQGQCLEDILVSSQHLLTMINDVLDLSKIESGKMELTPESFPLSQIINSVSRAMSPILSGKQQSLDIEIAKALPPVYANKNKIEQVLLNLVDNAHKFTPEGGTLKIMAESNRHWALVSVIDNGIGISREDQGRIFEPFCQLDNTLPNPKPGTGLGLALAKQIVERNGGSLWVKSQPGQGSQFIFSIPLDKIPHSKETGGA